MLQPCHLAQQRERYLKWPFHLLDKIPEPEMTLLSAPEDYGVMGAVCEGAWNPCAVPYPPYDEK
jgi:hypothetical protein